MTGGMDKAESHGRLRCSMHEVELTASGVTILRAGRSLSAIT